MTKRIVTKIGDIFEVTVDEQYKRYLQLIAIDKTQLNSDVIRVFSMKYPVTYLPDFEEITKGEVDFFTHTTTSAGVKWGDWTKVGSSKNIGDIGNIQFRETDDDKSVGVSSNWYVWFINQEFVNIGYLNSDTKKIELGLVYAAGNVVKRIKTGIIPTKAHPE